MERTSSRFNPDQGNGRWENREFVDSDRVPDAGGIKQEIHSSTLLSEEKLNRVEVQIFGQNYHIVGNENPDRVYALAQVVDRKMKEIAEHGKGISPLKIAILAALNICDEMLSIQENHQDIALKGEKLISLLSEVIEG